MKYFKLEVGLKFLSLLEYYCLGSQLQCFGRAKSILLFRLTDLRYYKLVATDFW